jgi:hypothetical protein
MASLPDRRDEVWDEIASAPIELHPPSPEDWLAYGREHRPEEEIDLDYVARIHAGSGGQPALLVGLLGPK